MSSPRARQQLITYISQLQLHVYAQSSKTNSVIAAVHQQNEASLLRVNVNYLTDRKKNERIIFV